MCILTPTNADASTIYPITDRSLPATMRTTTQDRYGDADVLVMRTVPVPQPADHQVLIEVDAAGLDRGAWHLMTGLPYVVRLMGFGFLRPKQSVPGLDVSGRIVALGSNVVDFQVGDLVFGIGSGTFAPFAVADAEKLAHRPVEVTSTQAAAAPISGLTALGALRDAGRVQPGQRVLVIGASGGVGTYAVQLARHFGAHVTGVASTAKLDLVRSLGAEHVIDYTRKDALDDAVRYDLILDIGGRYPIGSLRRVLTPNGTLVMIGGEDGGPFTGGMARQLRPMLLSPFVRQRLVMFLSGERGDDVALLGKLLASGDIVSAIDRSYALEEVPDAMRDLTAGRVRGKAIVKVTDC